MNKKIVRVILLSFAICMTLIITNACRNSESSTSTETQKIVTSFFKTYKGSGPRDAINQLLKSNNYISNENADSLGINLERITKDFDGFQDYEIISIKDYGNSIQQITCVVKYSQLPLRFNFRFYKATDNWRVQDFNFQTSFMNEIE